MKKRFFGLMMAILVSLPAGNLTALPRETMYNVGKFSLVGGLLGTLGFTGYMAYLNKAIANAQTPEEKAEILRTKNLLKKLNIVAMIVAAGGGAGILAGRGEDKPQLVTHSKNDELIASPGGSTSSEDDAESLSDGEEDGDAAPSVEPLVTPQPAAPTAPTASPVVSAQTRPTTSPAALKPLVSGHASVPALPVVPVALKHPKSTRPSSKKLTTPASSSASAPQQAPAVRMTEPSSIPVVSSSSASSAEPRPSASIPSGISPSLAAARTPIPSAAPRTSGLTTPILPAAPFPASASGSPRSPASPSELTSASPSSTSPHRVSTPRPEEAIMRQPENLGRYAEEFGIFDYDTPPATLFQLVERFNVLIPQLFQGDGARAEASLDTLADRFRKDLDIFLERGVSIDDKNDRGRTALTMAVCDRNTPAVPKLLIMNASPFIKDDQGKTAIDYALEDENMTRFLRENARFSHSYGDAILSALPLSTPKPADRLMRHLNGLTPGSVSAVPETFSGLVDLLTAKPEEMGVEGVYAQFVQDAEILLARGVDINAKDVDNKNRTALMSAAHSGYLPMVKFLVTHGADIGLKDNDGKTAEELAQPHPEVASYLKELRAGTSLPAGESEAASAASTDRPALLGRAEGFDVALTRSLDPDFEQLRVFEYRFSTPKKGQPGEFEYKIYEPKLETVDRFNRVAQICTFVGARNDQALCVGTPLGDWYMGHLSGYNEGRFGPRCDQDAAFASGLCAGVFDGNSQVPFHLMFDGCPVEHAAGGANLAKFLMEKVSQGRSLLDASASYRNVYDQEKNIYNAAEAGRFSGRDLADQIGRISLFGGGCMACVAQISADGRTCSVQNAGDSGCFVICRDGSVVVGPSQHKALGGRTKRDTGFVHGLLNDLETRDFQIPDNAEYLIVACDGVLDHISTSSGVEREPAISFEDIKRELELAASNKQNLGQALVDFVRRSARNSRAQVEDDTTALVFKFKPRAAASVDADDEAVTVPEPREAAARFVVAPVPAPAPTEPSVSVSHLSGPAASVVASVSVSAPRSPRAAAGGPLDGSGAMEAPGVAVRRDNLTDERTRLRDEFLVYMNFQKFFNSNGYHVGSSFVETDLNSAPVFKDEQGRFALLLPAAYSSSPQEYFRLSGTLKYGCLLGQEVVPDEPFAPTGVTFGELATSLEEMSIQECDSMRMLYVEKQQRLWEATAAQYNFDQANNFVSMPSYAGATEIQGKRSEMEDAVCVRDFEGNKLFGVIDGHSGGYKLAITVSRQFSDFLKAKLVGGSITDENICEAVKELDTFLLEGKVDGETLVGGAPAVFFLQTVDGKKRLINLGDCRAIALDADGNVIVGTKDHKPTDEAERKRIIDQGGKVQLDNRCYVGDSGLSVSRGFGDAHFKPVGSGSARNYVIGIKPDIYLLNSPVDFVVLACDGLWDKMSNEAAAAFVKAQRANGADCQEISKLLVAEAFRLGSGDNISVVVVDVAQMSAEAVGDLAEA